MRLSTNHYEEDEFDNFELLSLTSTPKVPAVNVPTCMESTVQELQKELCLLKTQVEILHDEVRHLKRKVKVNYKFYDKKIKSMLNRMQTK